VTSKSLIATSFYPPTLSAARAENAQGPEAQLKNFLRFAGRVLVFVSLLCFMLGGYLGFAHWWILTHWTKAEGTVLRGEIRQGSSGARNALGRSSNLYFFHCTVSYKVAGKTLESELDSPSSASRIDAQVWGGLLSPSRAIDILYDSSNPSRIRLANNPAEVALIELMKGALFLLISGLVFLVTSRRGQGPPEPS
jgi:hypothetical protein